MMRQMKNETELWIKNQTNVPVKSHFLNMYKATIDDEDLKITSARS